MRHMRIDSVEFGDSMSSDPNQLLMDRVTMASVLRQNFIMVPFLPSGSFGETMGDIRGAKIVIKNNDLGGSSLLEVDETVNIIPELLSVNVNWDSTPYQMGMKEETLLKRILDGSSFHHDYEFPVTFENFEDFENDLDDAIKTTVNGIFCIDHEKNPLVLFDPPMLNVGARSYNTPDGKRDPDAIWEIGTSGSTHPLEMFAFPSMFAEEHQVIGQDDSPPFLNMYIIEPDSIYMTSSGSNYVEIFGDDDLNKVGYIIWTVGFVIPFGRRVHRIRVRNWRSGQGRI